MSRPKHPHLDTCIALVKAGEMSAAEASRVYNIAKSSISRALSAKVCECCGRVIPNKGTDIPKTGMRAIPGN